jgi:hypothetical protein
MNDFPFQSIFSSEIKTLHSEDFDFNLALASLEKIGAFVPEVDSASNIDLLPIAFNACVANRVNRNNDVIDTKTAVDIYKNFINKPINIEHNREKVIGTILKAGFSEFGTDRPLSEEEVSKMDGPFNITLGGVLWKVVNPRITKLVENSSDPSSEDYLSISTSWELGFSNYNLLLLDNNEKNIATAEVISDPDQIEKYKGYLKAFGGSGTMDGGKKIYRKIIDKVVPLGVGITETPAADVKGILTIKPEQDMKVEASEAVEQKDISQNNKNTVDNNNNKVMKINAISDITDENLKQVSASVISDFISEEIKKASDQFEIEKNESQEAVKASLEKSEALTKELEALKAEYEKINQVLAELQKENEVKAKQELFNQRMTEFDGEFELSSEEREIIAGDISEMGEDAFAAYKKKMGVLLKGKKPAKVAEEVSEKGKVMASANASEVSDAVENAIDNAVVRDSAIPNSSQASESLVEKYKKAFSVEGFEVQL